MTPVPRLVQGVMRGMQGGDVGTDFYNVSEEKGRLMFTLHRTLQKGPPAK